MSETSITPSEGKQMVYEVVVKAKLDFGGTVAETTAEAELQADSLNDLVSEVLPGYLNSFTEIEALSIELR